MITNDDNQHLRSQDYIPCFSAEIPACRHLPRPKHGEYNDKVCKDGKVMNIGTSCHLSCHKGYSLHGPGDIKCDNHGTWVTSEESYCKSK